MRISFKHDTSSLHVRDALLKLQLLPLIAQPEHVLGIIQPPALLDLEVLLCFLHPVGVRVEHLVDLGQLVVVLEPARLLLLDFLADCLDLLQHLGHVNRAEVDFVLASRAADIRELLTHERVACQLSDGRLQGPLLLTGGAVATLAALGVILCRLRCDLGYIEV